MTTSPIHIHTLVSAPIEKVWNYYTLPEHITQWNFASEGWQCPRAENDLRPGGRYSVRMESIDGPEGFYLEAVYDEVVIGEGFTYTMLDGRKVTTRFKDLGASTEVNIHFDPEQEYPLDMQRDGWQAILENFRRYAKGKSQS